MKIINKLPKAAVTDVAFHSAHWKGYMDRKGRVFRLSKPKLQMAVAVKIKCLCYFFKTGRHQKG